jgi:hypothetical protein
MKFTDPSALKVGDKVFRSGPKNPDGSFMRPMDPKLDVGVVLEVNARTSMALVELHDAVGAEIQIFVPYRLLEAIG